MFFSDDMYSVLTILYNYLQMHNQISAFLKKNLRRRFVLHKKIILKYLCENC